MMILVFDHVFIFSPAGRPCFCSYVGTGFGRPYGGWEISTIIGCYPNVDLLFCILHFLCIRRILLTDQSIIFDWLHWIHWYTLACILKALKKICSIFIQLPLIKFFTRETAAFKIYCNWIERAQDICSQTRWVSVDPKMMMKTKLMQQTRKCSFINWHDKQEQC